MAKGEIEVEVKVKPSDRDAVILFDLLYEIKRLKEWRFEHCMHKTGWCHDKRECDRCKFVTYEE